MTNKPTQPAVAGLLGDARARILNELCGHRRTSAELAERVGTTSSAVRVHLEGLRDAGLVDYEVERRGVGKPKHVFALTPAAEYLLSAAYAPVFQAVLGAMRSRLNGDFLPTLRQAGDALAREGIDRGDDASATGLSAAVEMFSALGAHATVESSGGKSRLRSTCCPLAAITRQTPEVCQLVEQLLSTASGLEVRERCDRGEHPRCFFDVGSSHETMG